MCIRDRGILKPKWGTLQRLQNFVDLGIRDCSISAIFKLNICGNYLKSFKAKKGATFMSERAMSAPAGALEAKQQLAKSFRIKGIFIGVLSGFLYGGYTAFMTQGMAEGIWADWYAPTAALSAFAGTYVLSAVGAATNDICSAVWSIIYAAIIGRLGDFGRSLRTKPGKILIIAAIIGGPLASTAYVVGLQMAGSIIIPIAALNAAIRAIIG